MRYIFHDGMDQFVMVNVDNFLKFDKEIEGHFKLLEIVLQCLRNYEP